VLCVTNRNMVSVSTSWSQDVLTFCLGFILDKLLSLEYHFGQKGLGLITGSQAISFHVDISCKCAMHNFSSPIQVTEISAGMP